MTVTDPVRWEDPDIARVEADAEVTTTGLGPLLFGAPTPGLDAALSH
jgi:hypothetical protein